jgi:hypothetical protein
MIIINPCCCPAAADLGPLILKGTVIKASVNLTSALALQV